MPPLPTDFQLLEPTEKLVWLYVALAGEGEYSARGLASTLGIDKNSAGSALSRLAEQGFLLRLRPAAGRRAGLYAPVTNPAPTPSANTFPEKTLN